MPIYDFECLACGLKKEKIVGSDKYVIPCDAKDCDGRMTRLVSAAKGFKLKGSGFYKPGYN